jgi:hypothetical protein
MVSAALKAQSLAVALLVAAMLPMMAQQALATSVAQASSCAKPETPVTGEGGIEEQGSENANSRFGLDLAIEPFILSSAKPDDVSLSLRLCDLDSRTIEHASYEVTVAKVSEAQDRLVMQERFHSHAGPLVLQSYEGAGAVAVEGAERDESIDGWLAGNVTRVKNLIASSGIYNVTVRVLGAEEDTNMFSSDEIPRFQYTAFISESFAQQVQDYQNASAVYDVTLLSFHDKPYNFTFSNEKGVISWSIPFNWSQFAATEKSGMGSVSQAIVFSDPTFELSSMERDAFLLTVNGQPLEGQYNVRAYDAGSSVAKSPTIVVTIARNDTVAIAEKLVSEGGLPDSMDFTVYTSSVRVTPEFGPYAIAVAVAAMAAVVARMKSNRL